MWLEGVGVHTGGLSPLYLWEHARARSHTDYSSSTSSGVPFFTMYVASSDALPPPTFFAKCAVTCGDVQRIASLERDRWPAFQLILKRAVDDVGDFHPGMRMFGRDHARIEINTHLNHLTLGDVQVLAHQVRTVDA